jgi:hypothetical protein
MTLVSAARLVIVLSVIAPAPGGAQQAQSGTGKAVARPGAGDDHPSPQGFSVVLVLGDMQGGSAQDNLPAAARKALADVKDFLPYKGYRLLDSQWTMCCGSSPIMTRLRGPDDQEYDLELNPRPLLNGKWSVRFTLRDRASEAPATGGGFSGSGGGFSSAMRDKEIVLLTAQRNDLERRLADLRQKYSENHPEIAQVKTQIADTAQRIDAIRIEQATRGVSAAAGTLRDTRGAVIDTSFSMDVGETVVVGTSRLKGDKALIALLTAIPQRR